MPRVELTKESLEYTLNRIQEKLQRRLVEKGKLSLTSTHEVAGVIEEEWDEFKDAVHVNDHENYEEELLDIIVGCMVGIMSKQVKGLDW